MISDEAKSDFSVVSGVTESMKEATIKKFNYWDSISKKGFKESEEEFSESYKALVDPTIYTYAFLRRQDGSPFKMYSYQDLILNDDHKRIIFCAANQIGKSITLCIKGFNFAVKNPGTTTLMVSKTMPQSKDLLRQIKEFLTTSILDYKYTIGDTETKTEIYFRHYEEFSEFDEVTGKNKVKLRELKQSRIVCVPATEAALGYPADLLLIDELAFYENGEYFYKQIAQPRTYTTKGQIIVFSNPNGQQGIFWELWNDPLFHRYKFNFLDCPTNSQEEYDSYCAGLTNEQIDSTLNAEFTSPEGGFISLEERRAIQDERMNEVPPVLSEPVYIFFDWAKVRDRTVRGIGVPTKDGNGVYVYELKEYPANFPYDEIFDDLLRFLESRGSQSVAMIGWDNSGVGKGIEDFIGRIRQFGIICTPVEFSLENKSAIYVNFKLLVEKTVRGEKCLSIPKVTECDKQLSQLRFKKSSRGYWMVHHERENDRDDFPDCIAGLCSLIIQPGRPPVSVSMIENDYEEGKTGRIKDDDIERCECGNILEPWEDICSNCFKKV